MSTKVVTQTITSRTEPGEYSATIERYKTNGWNLHSDEGKKAILFHPDLVGVKVILFDTEATS